MKRAFFGGTFDPIHAAHVTVAREAADAFGVGEVHFIDRGVRPLLAQSITRGAERWLDRHLETAEGPLPAPAASFYQRFGGLD